MAVATKKTARKKAVQFEPGRVLIMVAVIAVLTLVFIGVIVTL